MTDKIKKLEQLSEEVYPKFPTLNRGGYVEDSVDAWLDQHLKEVSSIIDYQNYGVDLVDGLEGELTEAKVLNGQLEAELDQTKAYTEGLEAEVESLKSRIAEMDEAGSRSLVEEVSSTSEVDGLRNELAEAKARITELETNIVEMETAAAVPAPGTEATRAATLLQHASELGSQYIEQAKADGEQIRKDAEDKLVEMRREIEELDAQRFATINSLREFHAYELAKLEENPVFAAEAEEEEALPEEDSVEEGAVDENIDDKTIDGVPVTQEQIQKWADEAEADGETETDVEAETDVADADVDVTEEEITASDDTLDEGTDEEVEAENGENVEDDSKTEDDLR